MPMKPQIVIQDIEGYHNKDLQRSTDRLLKGNTYKDLSTICVVPTRGVIPAKVVQSWLNMLVPMNQKFTRIFIMGMEVGEAYNNAVEFIINHPELSKWKYMLTIEEDNIPPPDGLLKLYEAINTPPGYDAVGGLYWTKGEGGQPMIYGDPSVMPKNFIPQVPKPDTIQQCNGGGMGFNLFKLEIFKDPKLPRPFFKTIQEHTPHIGSKVMTQDLFFYQNAGMLGYKYAVDNRIKVGHFDIENDMVW